MSWCDVVYGTIKYGAIHYTRHPIPLGHYFLSYDIVHDMIYEHQASDIGMYIVSCDITWDDIMWYDTMVCFTGHRIPAWHDVILWYSTFYRDVA